MVTFIKLWGYSSYFKYLYLVCTWNVLGQTVSSYGWCNRIPRVVFPLRFFSECISVWTSLLPKVRETSKFRSCLKFLQGTGTCLTDFLTESLPRTAPVIRTTLLLWYLCVHLYVRNYHTLAKQYGFAWLQPYGLAWLQLYGLAWSQHWPISAQFYDRF